MHETQMRSLRAFWYQTLNNPSPRSRSAKWINGFLAVVIIANCASVAVETIPSIYHPRETFFYWFELFSTLVYLAEYLLRLWSCAESRKFSAPITGRLRWMAQPLSVLDLVVLVTYLAPVDLRFLRIFRLGRLLRLFNLERFDTSLNAIIFALEKRVYLLMVSFTLMLMMAYVFAALIFMIEHTVQPDKFTSIPETIWWAIVTLTTIGYGDVTPITPLGKLLAACVMIIGIGIFALPTAIVTAAILEAGHRQDQICPHCGNKIHHKPTA